MKVSSDGSPYEKRVDAKGRVLSDKCIADEVPFDELPEGWVWARLEDCCDDILVPQRDKPSKFAGDIPWCRIEDIEGGLLGESKTGKVVDPKTVQSMHLKVNPIGTVLCSNSATIGVPAVVTTPLVTNQRFIGFVCAQSLFNWYLYYLFLANHNYICGVGTGTTQSYIARSTFERMLIPLPPLAEQRRIVGRVEELMPLVNEYGKLEDAREALDAALPGRLRKSVLQMAVQGKLVPQDPADEPASALLGRIREQRRELVKQKKAKTPKGGESVIFTGSDGRRYEKRVDSKGRESEPVCIEDEIPFEIPEGWEWARLQGLICLLSGTDLKPGQYNSCHNGIPYLTGASNFSDSDLLENRWTVEPSRISLKGDLLFTCKGTVGQMAINRFDKAHIARQIMAISPNDYEMLSYLTVFLKATVEEIKTDAKGVIPGIERGTLLSRLIPVPPLTEQSRIAEKVVGLFEVIQ